LCSAPYTKNSILEVEVDLVRVQSGDAGIADRRQDPSQVRVGGEERGLHERRMGDRIGDLPAFGLAAPALDLHRHELGRTLAIPNDGLRQLLGYAGYRSFQRLFVFPRSGRRPPAGGETYERVIRRRVSVDGARLVT